MLATLISFIFTCALTLAFIVAAPIVLALIIIVIYTIAVSTATLVKAFIDGFKRRG